MRKKFLIVSLFVAVVTAFARAIHRVARAIVDAAHIPFAFWRDPGFRDLCHKTGLDIPPMTRWGFMSSSIRVFERNGWKVIEIITLPAIDGTVMLIWDAGMPYPIVSNSFNHTDARERTIELTRHGVSQNFDKMFLPGRVWAGPAKFDQWVKSDRYLKRLGESDGKQQLPDERQRSERTGLRMFEW